MSATPEEIAARLEDRCRRFDALNGDENGWEVWSHLTTLAVASRAAAALIRAQAERERVLEEALRPFANLWLDADEDQRPSNPFYQRNEAIATLGDLRRARAALAKATGDK